MNRNNNLILKFHVLTIISIYNCNAIGDTRWKPEKPEYRGNREFPFTAVFIAPMAPTTKQCFQALIRNGGREFNVNRAHRSCHLSLEHQFNEVILLRVICISDSDNSTDNRLL